MDIANIDINLFKTLIHKLLKIKENNRSISIIIAFKNMNHKNKNHKKKFLLNIEFI